MNVLVARKNPSTAPGPMPRSLSNASLMGESLMTMTGNGTRPASSPVMRSRPEVVSSVAATTRDPSRSTDPAMRSAPLSRSRSGSASRMRAMCA